MAELPIKMTQDSQHRVTGFEVEKCIGDLDISMGSLTFVQMLCALLFLLCIGRSSSSSEFSVIGYDTTDLTSDETLFLLYERWLAEHGKVYKENDLDQKHTRFQIFKHNLLYINSHNKRNESYSLGLNEFSDLTNDEFMSMYVGSLFPTSSIETDHHNSYPHQSIDDANLPESVDWREKGAVTSVKNQGSCGSCWIFSAIAAVEGINQIKTGNLISLSEQEVLDCNFANQGCKGGSKSTVFQYIIKNGGIDTEAAYPYKAKKGICNQNVEKVVTIDGYTSLPSDEYNLQKGVVKQPIGVSIAVGNDFQHYKSGLFTGTCGAKINHGVTVVGYTSGNEACWIVKNSWGTSWGENGFFRFPRNTGDQYGKCYIARSPTHPIKNGSNPSNLDHFPI